MFYKRADDQFTAGKIPTAAISYDEKVFVIGSRGFMQSWLPFFASDEWKDRPKDRKSLKSLFSRTMMPVRFVEKEEFDAAVAQIKAAIPLGGADVAKRYAWRDDDVVVQKAPERKKK